MKSDYTKFFTKEEYDGYKPLSGLWGNPEDIDIEFRKAKRLKLFKIYLANVRNSKETNI